MNRRESNRAKRWYDVIIQLLLAILHFLLRLIAILSRAKGEISWTPGSPAGEGTAERIFALAVDRSNRAHLVYLADGSLLYSWWTGDTWQPPEVVERRAEPVQSPALAFDTAGNLHLVFVAGGTVYHKVRNGRGWPAAVEINSGFLPGQTTLVASGDTLHLAYQMDQSLMVAVLGSDGWQSETAVAGVGCLFFHDLAIGRDGRLHVVYNDPQGQALHYTVKTAAGWQEPQVILTGSDDRLGEYNSLALDRNGRPHVGFQADNQLQHARLGNGAWEVTAIEATEKGGYFNQIVLLDGKRPGITYHDASGSGSLHFAHQVEAEWKTEVLDSADAVGESAVMALGRGGRPQVAYYDHANSAIKMIIGN